MPTKADRTRHAAPAGAFRFAEEFLARRTEFWLLYAQVFVATFFIAAITTLILFGVIGVEVGLPALSTVVGSFSARHSSRQRAAHWAARNRFPDEPRAI